jgi:putative molybdopterin biosynthesis protein
MQIDLQNNSERLPTRLLTGKDVAHLLKISSSQAYKIMRRGELPAVHIGRSIRVKPEDLETYIDRNTTSYGGF